MALVFFTAFKTHALYQVYSTVSTYWNHPKRTLKTTDALDATIRNSDLIDLGLDRIQGSLKVPYGDSDDKESACNADVGSIPGWGLSPGEENCYPLQYS